MLLERSLPGKERVRATRKHKNDIAGWQRATLVEQASLAAADRRGRRLRHLHARFRRLRDKLECRSGADQGLSRRRDHRSALLALLHRRGPGQGPAGDHPGHGEDHGTVRDRGLARAQGRQPLLEQRHRPAGAGRAGPAGRLRQDHARHHRAAGRPSGPAGKRAPLPPSHRRRGRLRALHARPQRRGGELEPGRPAHEGLCRRRDRGPALLQVLHPRGPRRGPAGQGAGDGRPRGSLRSRRMAPAQGRQPLLGVGGGRRHSRQRRKARRLRQDHARHHRTARRAAGVARQRAAVPAAGQQRRRLRASTCSIPTASSAAGTPAPRGSRATARPRSSASMSRASIPSTTAPPACRCAPCRRR